MFFVNFAHSVGKTHLMLTLIVHVLPVLIASFPYPLFSLLSVLKLDSDSFLKPRIS